MVDQELKTELLDLRRRDHETRQRLVESGELFVGYAQEMEEVHLENARRLETILASVGWPGTDLVGEEGAEAAWLIAQHAISAPAFQRRCCDLLSKAVTAGTAQPHHLAYLTDRILFNERRPQLYGTIFDWDPSGQLSPWPIREPESVDERRAAVGLPPLSEWTQRVREEAQVEGNTAPESFEKRQQEIAEWSREVGWLKDDPGAG